MASHLKGVRSKGSHRPGNLHGLKIVSSPNAQVRLVYNQPLWISHFCHRKNWTLCRHHDLLADASLGRSKGQKGQHCRRARTWPHRSEVRSRIWRANRRLHYLVEQITSGWLGLPLSIAFQSTWLLRKRSNATLSKNAASSMRELRQTARSIRRGCDPRSRNGAFRRSEIAGNGSAIPPMLRSKPPTALWSAIDRMQRLICMNSPTRLSESSSTTTPAAAAVTSTALSHCHADSRAHHRGCVINSIANVKRFRRCGFTSNNGEFFLGISARRFR